MRATMLPPSISRDPDNELYDRGCDLVEAAAAIRRAAASRQAGRAVPAVLGCMESALEELLCACDGLEQTTTELTPPSTDYVDPRAKAVAHRMRRGYRNLREALSDARAAAAAARSLAGRALHGGPLSSDRRR
jgi:hypothetical protein